MYSHIRSRYRYIFVSRNIYSGRIVHLVISPCSNGITGDITFTMVKNRIYISREYRLIVFIHSNCWISPPQKSLRKWSWVIYFHLNFESGTPRTQCKTSHAFLMKHTFPLTNPHYSTTIFPSLNRIVNWQKSAGTMVLWPVEFNTSRNPWPCQSYQSRLNYVIVINKMTLFNLIVRHLDTSAQFRQNHHFDIFILQINSVIILFPTNIFYLFNNRIRINDSTTSLIYTFL